MSRYVNASDDQLVAFGRALTAAATAAGITTQRDLARLGREAGIDRGDQAFHEWMKGRTEPSRTDVAILERLCNVEPGHLSRHLGYVPVGVSTAATLDQLILAEPSLSDESKRILIALLETLRQAD